MAGCILGSGDTAGDRTKFQLSLTLHAISKTIRKNGRQRITNQLKYKIVIVWLRYSGKSGHVS